MKPRTILLDVLGHGTAASFLSGLGTMVLVFGTMAWIVLFDSRSLWPGTTRRQRLARFLSFTRRSS